LAIAAAHAPTGISSSASGPYASDNSCEDALTAIATQSAMLQRTPKFTMKWVSISHTHWVLRLANASAVEVIVVFVEVELPLQLLQLGPPRPVLCMLFPL
jgi:acyl transferase domain-containing protein